MLYLKFVNPMKPNNIIAGYDLNDKIVFWCEYDRETLIGVFHDNTQLAVKAIVNTNVTEVFSTTAEVLLCDIANATHGRYEDKIKEFLFKDSLNDEATTYNGVDWEGYPVI